MRAILRHSENFAIVNYFVEFFGHFSNYGNVLHRRLHLGCDASLTAAAVDEELHEHQQSIFAVAFVLFDPIIHNFLERVDYSQYWNVWLCSK